METSNCAAGFLVDIIRWRDALYESNLTYKAKHIGMLLSTYYRANHPTYPSIRVLSVRSSLTVNPVQDGITELEKNGFIKREQKRIPGNRFLSNIYTFIGVTENRHVSPRDTSNDTSFDTSYDTSPRDTELEQLDKIVIKEKNNKKENGSSCLEEVEVPAQEFAVLVAEAEKEKAAILKWDVLQHLSMPAYEYAVETAGLYHEDINPLIQKYNKLVEDKPPRGNADERFNAWVKAYLAGKHKNQGGKLNDTAPIPPPLATTTPKNQETL